MCNDLFCSGVREIEMIGGGIARLYLYSEMTGADGDMERRVVGQIVMPLSTIPMLIEQLLGCVHAHYVVGADGPVRIKN